MRIRLPNGAELEAEGSPEFVRAERAEFLIRITAPASATTVGVEQRQAPQPPKIQWDAVTEIRGRNIHLRSKLRGESGDKDACLILLAASSHLLSQPKPTATLLAKWIRSSGHPIQRMDRTLQTAVELGEVLSSGSRRARRYELTASGRLKAYLLAEKLGRDITGNP